MSDMDWSILCRVCHSAYRSTGAKVMSYSCSCDYDPPSFYDVGIVTARKAHQCYECSGIISPKEKYERVAGMWDGDFGFYKTCERCVDLRTWVKNNIPCVCWTHGNMHEDLRETVREIWRRNDEETSGLLFGFLRRMVMIEKFNKRRTKKWTPINL